MINTHPGCPVCGSDSTNKVLTARDYTVSKEEFQIAECNDCTLRFTMDAPGVAAIGRYYKSEDYISHTNTSKGLINRLYQLVRKRTMSGKRRLITSHSGMKTGRLLDVGSGVGSFVNEMNNHGWDVTGLEPDDEARNIAEKQYHVKLRDISAFYSLPPGNYDAITLWHVMEHVHDLHDYVKQLRNLLKENGRLFIAVPNYTAKEEKNYGEYWAAYDVPRHLYHFSPQAMKVLLEKHGLKIRGYKPMWYDSFYISMLSSKYKNGKTNLIAAFFHGLISNLNAMTNVKKCSSVIYIVSKS